MIENQDCRKMFGLLLFITFTVGTSCDITGDPNPTIENVHSIDSLVEAFNQKLAHVQPGQPQPDDSTIVQENYSVVTCYKRIDSTIDKIVLNEQYSTGTATDFYYINGSLALTAFYRAKGHYLIQIGKRYFDNNTAIYVSSNDSLPSPSSSLRQADSIKRVCATMLNN